MWGRIVTKRDAGAGSAWWRRQQSIIASAQAAGLKRGALALLRVMLAAETGRTQTVIRSREALAEAMGANIKTVERNMGALVASGAVEKLYCRGGQGKANVYRLKEIPHYNPQNGGDNGGGGQYLPQNGEIPPPFCPNTSPKMGEPSYPSYSSREKGRGLVAPDAPPHGGSAPVAAIPPERQAIAQIMQAERCGYGVARDILARRQQAEAGDLH